jgi:uncharacterized protein YqeY
MGNEMSLLESIKVDQRNARIVRDTVKATVLTTLIGEVEGELTRLKPEQRTAEKTNATVLAKIKQFLDKIRENELIAGDRRDSDWCDELQKEREAIEGYMPRQMDKSELKRVLIQKFGDAIRTESKGVLMKFLKEGFAGRYDGKLAAQVVDEFLK